MVETAVEVTSCAQQLSEIDEQGVDSELGGGQAHEVEEEESTGVAFGSTTLSSRHLRQNS